MSRTGEVDAAALSVFGQTLDRPGHGMEGYIFLYRSGHLLVARVTADTNTRLAFTWKIVVPDSKGARVQLVYVAIHLKNLNHLVVGGHAIGRTITFHGYAACEMVCR